MSQISKCPKVTVVLTYWEASGEVSELSYNLLFDSSNLQAIILSDKTCFHLVWKKL